MTGSALVAFLLGAVLVAEAQGTKCLWDKKDNKCNFNELSLTQTFGGNMAKYLDMLTKAEECYSHSGAQTGCTNVDHCIYDTASSKCIYALHNVKSGEILGAMSGCNAFYRHSYKVRSCGTYYTQTACDAISACNWESNSMYNANAVPTKRFDGNSNLCLDTKVAEGQCKDDYVQILCNKAGADVNHVIGNISSALVTCAIEANAAAVKTCMERELTCAGLATPEFATILKNSVSTPLSVSDTIAYHTAINLCMEQYTCNDMADLYFPLPMSKDLPEVNCASYNNEACNTTCFWEPTYSQCMRTKDIRNTPPGTNMCILTQMNKIDKKLFDTDTAMIAAYKEKRATDKECSLLTAESTCTANTKCEWRSPSAPSCDNAGVVTYAAATTSCAAKKETPSQEKEKTELLYGDTVTLKVKPIEDTCKAFTTNTTCNGATYTAAETNILNAAASASVAAAAGSGTASFAHLAAHCSALPWLLSAVALAVAKY
jgi:hypothetical protein